VHAPRGPQAALLAPSPRGRERAGGRAGAMNCAPPWLRKELWDAHWFRCLTTAGWSRIDYASGCWRRSLEDPMIKPRPCFVAQQARGGALLARERQTLVDAARGEGALNQYLLRDEAQCGRG
jgi:hypothetical protein